MVAHPQIDSSALDHLKSIQGDQTTLTKAIGHGPPALRDVSGNILVLNPAAPNPLLVAQGHDVALNMAPSTVLANKGTLTVTDETGQQPRPIVASNFYGDVGDPVNGNTGPTGGRNVYSDTRGKHFGDVGDPVNGNSGHNVYSDTYGKHFGNLQGEVGTPGQRWHCYGTFHGDSDGGTHYGPQSGDCTGTHHGNLDSGTVFAETGVPGQAWNLYATLHGTVVAPSERSLKVDVRAFDAGALVDAVPSTRWRYHHDTEDISAADEHDHAGIMIDDLADHAPWLVRRVPESPHRHYNPNDLIGVLWAALREERAARVSLEQRMTVLESRGA